MEFDTENYKSESEEDTETENKSKYSKFLLDFISSNKKENTISYEFINFIDAQPNQKTSRSIYKPKGKKRRHQLSNQDDDTNLKISDEQVEDLGECTLLLIN